MAQFQERPVVAMVPGSWHSGWYWQYVAKMLDQAGYPFKVFTLDSANPGLNLDGHAAAVTQSLQEFEDIILVGHSYGCNITTRAAGNLSLRALLHVCPGFEPSTIGRPLPNETEQMPQRHTPLSRQGIIELGNNVTRYDPTLAQEVFYHDCSKELAIAASERLQPQYRSPSNPALVQMPDVTQYCILGTLDRVVNPEWTRYISEEWLNVQPTEITTGHSPMLARPDILFSEIFKIAQAA